MRRIDEIIIHCTETPAGRRVTVADIDQWHKDKGWVGIGYHYVVYLDGSVHMGREEEVVGAHCAGHNAHSIGVCYVGGLSKDGKTLMDTRTTAQKEAMLVLLRVLKRSYPNAEIHGHRDFSKKACPCFDATEEYKDLEGV